MTFPPGKPLLLVIAFALIGGVTLLVRPTSIRPVGDQQVWVFDESHARTYQTPSATQPALLDLYQQATGRHVEVQLTASRALDARLLSLTLSDAHGKQVPDLVEIEIGSVGKYFRSSPEHNGLLPLDGFLAAEPDIAGQILPARQAMWTSGGTIFGIPHDVHPVSITYRKDLFEQAGIDLSQCSTWNIFRTACLRYQAFYAARGEDRRAIQLARWNASDLMIMLQQQRLELIDSSNHLHLTDPRVARTVAFYAGLVAGPDAIAAAVTPSSTLYVQDLADGHSAALFTPDWRIAYLRTNPALIGKLAMMPLPRFEPSDAPTASWGGTMVAIPKNTANPQAAWELLKFLQLSPQAMTARASHTTILPAIRSAWNDPAWQTPDPLFAGQPIGTLYIELARQLPAQHANPYNLLVAQTLAGVLSSVELQVGKLSPAELEAYAAGQLAVAQAQLEKLLTFAEAKP